MFRLAINLDKWINFVNDNDSIKKIIIILVDYTNFVLFLSLSFVADSHITIVNLSLVI